MREFSGSRLKSHRVASGLKLERLALSIDRSVYTIHQYENGRVLPTANVIGALADTLNLSIDDLYTDRDDVAVAA